MAKPKKKAYKEYVEAEEQAQVEEIEQGFTEDGTFLEALESDGIDEALEVEEPEKSLHEQADDEFLEGIIENKKPLTAKERARKIAELQEDIEKTKTRMSEIEEIAELSKSAGFRKLVEEVKSGVHGLIDEEDVKESAKSLKSLDSVLITERLVNGFNFQFNSKKADIKKWERDIEELKAGQLSLLDGGQTEEETPIVAETEELANVG